MVLVVLLASVFLIGCSRSDTGGYSTYDQPQQQQYVGGGCGVAPSTGYESTPVEALELRDSAL